MANPSSFFFLPSILFISVSCVNLVFSSEDEGLSVPSFSVSRRSDSENDYYVKNNSSLSVDETCGIILKKQDDPFSLENLEKARRTLLNGESGTSLTNAEVEIITAAVMTPTHHAITIFPKDLRSISEIETTEGVRVAYYPFNQQIVGNSTGFEGLRYKKYIPEENPHKILYSDARTSNGEAISNYCEGLPVLYAVWPIWKSIPDSLDYRIDYDVVLPSSMKIEQDNELYAIRLIQKESISQSRGLSEDIKNLIELGDSSDYKGVGGYIYCSDNYTNSYQGIGGLSLRFQYGSFIVYGATSNDGSFTVTDIIPDGATFYCSYSRAWQWEIRANNSTQPVQYFFGSIEDVLGTGVQYNYNLSLYPSVTGPTNQISRAISFYFRAYPHDVTPVSLGTPIIIKAMDDNNNNQNGNTVFSSNAPPTITIYNNNVGYHAKVIGTTLHELGHVTMYYEQGGVLSIISNAVPLLFESFASYIGWYLCEYYYSWLGYSVFDSFNSISGQKRQEWDSSTPPSYGRYSPLFIDLADYFNQHSVNNSLPDDSISGVPYSIIRQVMLSSTSWSGCRSKLQEYIGNYYSSSDFSTFVAPYDLWFSSHSNDSY